MKIKPIAVLALSALLVASMGYAVTAMAADDEPNVFASAQSNTQANDASNSDNGQDNSSSANDDTNANDDDQASPDTATGDDDY